MGTPRDARARARKGRTLWGQGEDARLQAKESGPSEGTGLQILGDKVDGCLPGAGGAESG